MRPESITHIMPSVSTAMPWTNCNAVQLPMAFISHDGNGSISGSVRPLSLGAIIQPSVAGTPGSMRGIVTYSRLANAFTSDIRMFGAM